MDQLEPRQLCAITPASEFTYSITNSQATITGYIGSAASVEIPLSINNAPVTSIGDNAFFNCSWVTSVALPASMERIGFGAFAGTSIATLNLPANVHSFSNSVYACFQLTTISVDPANTTFTSIDGILYDRQLQTLVRCPAGRAQDVSIPATVDVIASYAFAGCSQISVIEGLKPTASIGFDAFGGCWNLQQPLDPSNPSAPAGHLTYTVTPEGIVITGYYGEATDVVIPDTILGRPVVTIGSDAFNTRRHITSVRIPSTVTVIGNATFANCTNLRSITLPENVSAIGFNAFQYCLSLTSITLPAGLSQIGPVVFFGSTNLEAINVDEGNAYFASVEGLLYDKTLTTLIECPQGKRGTVVLPDTVTSIGRPGLDMVFAECGKLSVIVIPDSVTAIVDRAFENCSAVLVTTGASPFAPGRPSGVHGNGSVQLSWTAPASTGGLPVKDYRIQYSTNGGVTWQTVSRPASTATTATVTGLVNGRGYRFRVACVTNAGVRPYSTASAVIVPAATPGMPVAVNAVRGNGSVQLSWTAPAPNGSKPITNYIIQHSRDGGRTWVTFNRPASTATTATVTGLTNGVGYVFRVSAVNATGVGLPSPLSNVVVPCTVPGAPSRLTAMPGTGSATLTWAAPTTNGGAPIINYVVQHSVDGGRSWVTVNRPASTATTATVPGLTRGATYVFRVSAVNAAGIGMASPVSGAVTPQA